MNDQPTPVYPEYHKDGVRFQLYSDGTVMAWTKDLEPREIGKLSVSGEDRPWIPKHKNFNSLCRQMFREGDVDDLVAEQRRISDARSMKRKAGEELYEALIDIVTSYEALGAPLPMAREVEVALDALAKARGEK
ncbi:MAG: hypothetical protein CME72_11640 [Halomonadaceae bacterium]|nr:hypothetical protein [Halomonadaceae bacterium]